MAVSLSKSSAISIKLLQQAPEYFAQVAAWHHQECERQGLQSTLATRQQRLLLHVQTNAIPKTIILLQGKKLIGCVSLVNYNFRSDKSVLIPVNSAPLWLSNLFVADEERQQGFGNVLIDAAKKYSLKLGAQELWLSAAEFTDYYQKRGWEIVRKTRLGGKHVNVMRVPLNEIPIAEVANA
jgi:N-acetylglutamate synthase-like GNAT family acetyltransferase